jgi:hypothetical protein
VVAVVLAVVIVALGVMGAVLLGTRGDDTASTTVPAGSGVARGPALDLPEVPEGYQLFADGDGSFALVVPRGWETVSLDDTSVRRARDRLEDDNPAVAAALVQAVELVGDRGLAFAAEPSGDDGFVANVNLLLGPRSTESLAGIAAAGRAELERLGAQVSDPRAVAIGDRPALVVEIQFPTPDGPVPEHQVYVASGYRFYALTIAGADRATAEAILASLRVP